jgi:GT2 family glycosyltransferase
MPEVTIVIPTWNRATLLASVLEGLRAQTLQPASVIVVDNGSTDDSVALARGAGARVVELPWNAGFCRAVNFGIQKADTPWVAVLNNDVNLDPEWLERLATAAEGSGAWFATGKILRDSGHQRIDGTFDTLCLGGCAWRAGHDRPDGPEWNARRVIRFAPLTAALFRRELFERIGLLDECFESYLEDVEFGLRCALGGYEGLYVPDALCKHAGSSTYGRWHPATVRLLARNQLLLVAKHYPASCIMRLSWRIAVAQLLWGALAFRQGAGVAYLRGKAAGLRLFPTLRRRFRPAEPARLLSILHESERQIREVQAKTGSDLFWRLYFTLT